MRKLMLTAAALSVSTIIAIPALSSATPSPLDLRALGRAQAIRAEVDARYRSAPSAMLEIREATATQVVESFTLLSFDLLRARIVAADNGIYYAICVVRAPCHASHARFARPAAALLPRRIALELALRTFLETSVDVVAVSLPTRDYTLFLMERDGVERDPDLVRAASALNRDPTHASASWSRPVVDRVTRPRVFTMLGIEPTPAGGDTLAGIRRWPDPIAGTSG
jgi:hypothetical protein